MDLISILAIVNIVIHIGPFLGLFLRSTGQLKFMLVTDVIITIAYLLCCPFTAFIWCIVTYVDWKEHGYLFKG